MTAENRSRHPIKCQAPFSRPVFFADAILLDRFFRFQFLSDPLKYFSLFFWVSMILKVIRSETALPA